MSESKESIRDAAARDAISESLALSEIEAISANSLASLVAAITALVEQRVGEWLPIESAPDGVPVLVAAKEWVGVATAINGWWGRGHAYTARVHPTHWRPLPAPPTIQKERT